jgi:hypothetical protein
MYVIRKDSRKVVSFLLTLAMVAAMFAIMPAPVYAQDTWDGGIDISWTGDGTSTSPYNIDTAEELAGLAYQVNDGNAYSGEYFLLGDDINLAGLPWTSIGGGYGTSSYGDYALPTTSNCAFAGVFDGNDKTVSNLSITTTTGGGCTGLFGYLTGGVMNLTVGGEINIDNVATYCVGGVAGYVTGSVRNCNSDVDITITNPNSRYIGGIAGMLANLTTSPNPYTSTIDYCSNRGDIKGPARIGGIVGETARASSACNAAVDQCFNTGKVTNNTSGKLWSGGIVGYSMGSISNCYNSGELNDGDPSDARDLGGITGILYGYSGNIYGKMDSCYNYGVFTAGSHADDRQLYCSADRSPNVVITSSFWLTPAAVTQTTDSTWGTCHYVTEASIQQLSGQTDITALYTYGQPATATTGSILYFLNRQFEGRDTGIFATAAGINNGYPYLVHVPDHKLITDITAGGVYTLVNTNTSPAIYLDGQGGNDSNNGGSASQAVKTFAKAKEILTTTATSIKAIYITGTVTVDTTTSWALGVDAPSLVRSYNFGGTLIEVTDNGDLTLSDITIDGNDDKIGVPTGRLINVEGGILTLDSGATLEDNRSNTNGGAVRIMDGEVTMEDGSVITDCISVNQGGGVAVYTDGTFTMNGGTITGNSTSQQGGGVIVGSDGEFLMTGGEIFDNEVSSGLGDGVYVEGEFTVSQAGISTVDAGTIYLPTGKTISLGAALSGDSLLTVLCEDADVDVPVATGASDGDEAYFAYDGGDYIFWFDDPYIRLTLE